MGSEFLEGAVPVEPPSTEAVVASSRRPFNRRSFMVGAAAISSAAVAEGAMAAEGSHSALGTTGPVEMVKSLAAPSAVDLAAVTSFVPGTTGIYAPSDWGKTGGWATARAAAANRQVNVVVLGDSIGEGYWSSNLLTKGFVGATISSLRALYGDGGSGFDSTVNTPGLSSGSGATVYSSTGGVWGTLEVGMNDITATGPSMGATLSNPSVVGTSVDVYYDTSCGSFTVTIDGILVGSIIGPAPQFAIGKATFPGLASGIHNVTITQSTGTACAIMGVVGRNPTGILGWNMSRWGRTAGPGGSGNIVFDPAWLFGSYGQDGLFASLEDLGAVGDREVVDCVTTSGSMTVSSASAEFTSADVGALVSVNGVVPGTFITSVQSATSVQMSTNATASGTKQVLTIYASAGSPGIPKTSVPDLFVGELGINDAAVGNTAATYISYVNGYFNLARKANPLCDLVWILPPLNNGADPNTAYFQYARELRALCETYGATFIDLFAISRNTPATWLQLGYMGDGLADGRAGADPVHWWDAGHNFVYQILLSLLAA